MSLRMTEAEFKDFMAKKGNSVRIQKQQKKRGKTKDEFQSMAEERYYYLYIQPMEFAGLVKSWTMHKSFVVMDAFTYQKKRYKERVYTPDFFIELTDGSTRVIEIKGTKIRKLQREYPLKKQLFIQRYCIPNNWLFEEIPAEELTQAQTNR